MEVSRTAFVGSPDGRFTKVVGDPLINGGSQSVGCAWADLDNDGWSDFGAKVRIQATVAGQSRWQMRQFDGGDGASGGSVDAHFGLGEATNLDTLRIEWPSGIVQELRDLPTNQFLTVTEAARLQGLGADVLRIQSWKAMAFEVQTSTDLTQWSPLTTVTKLTGPWGIL
ncbi:MAG: CRTAC1 family protein [Verrucomicrobiia bacterium]